MALFQDSVESETVQGSFSSTGFADEVDDDEMDKRCAVTDEDVDGMYERWLEEQSQPSVAQQMRSELAKFYAADEKLAALLADDARRLAVAS